MHVCLIAPNDIEADPRAAVSRYLLEKSGHRISIVAVGPGPSMPGYSRVDPAPRGLLGRLRSRRATRADRISRLTALLAQAAMKTGADLYLPTDLRALDAATRAALETKGSVARTPKMPSAGDVDLIDLATLHPELAAPVAGYGPLHTPADRRSPYSPAPGRHRRRRVVLCYRRSEINPGRYLEAALTRSGAELRVETGGIDLSTVEPGTDMVVFVEGPYPALEVTGSTTAPVLFWLHHGEHHLHANLRLADRYRADAVLMAHSWHLAFWFPAPVHRFPFGMATELLDPSKPLAMRRYDVAIVGAGLSAGGQYGRRQHLIDSLRSSLPESRLGFREQISAHEMAQLYADSRIVLNEGGTRHFPITMRVLEAVGSGAVLLSDSLPGTEVLLEPGREFSVLTDDVSDDVNRILSDLGAAQTMADAALERASGLHSYDHRVDELFAIAEKTTKRTIPEAPVRSGLAAAIAADVEVQRVAYWNAPEIRSELPDREAWDAARLAPDRLARGKMESVAIRADRVDDVETLLLAARRYAYVDGDLPGLSDFLLRNAPQAVPATRGAITRIDFMAPSYRIMEFETT